MSNYHLKLDELEDVLCKLGELKDKSDELDKLGELKDELDELLNCMMRWVSLVT